MLKRICEGCSGRLSEQADSQPLNYARVVIFTHPRTISMLIINNLQKPQNFIFSFLCFPYKHKKMFFFFLCTKSEL